MIDSQQLAQAYARNTSIIKMQTDGLTHEESLLQPPFRANCLNWVVGHINVSRALALEALGAEPPIARAVLAAYVTESEPVTADGAGVLRLEALIAALERSGERLVSALTSASAEELARVTTVNGRQRSVADGVFGLYFHETWHAGQTELLRQLAGRDDKVI